MPRGETATALPPAEPARSDSPALALVAIPGGIAQVGTDRPMIPADGEGPMRAVLLSPFHIAATAVSNADFARFVSATGYRTTGEQQGAGFVFQAHVAAPEAAHTPASPSWWRRVEGACWNRPFGPDSSLSGREDHPVVQVSRHDAEAFCRWSGTRLPAEAEWEHAARGGLLDQTYPWGDRAPDDAFLPCNIWQGDFPRRYEGRDGWTGTSPVASFAANGYGLYQMCGNVWEWTACLAETGARSGDPILKGGSHLCHASYCHRYRIAARMSNSPATTTSHIGFRVAG